MRIINRRINDLMSPVLKLGYAGENEHTRVVLDCADVFAQYPQAVPAVTVQPAAGLAYPAIVRRDGDTVIWDVTDSDLAAAGHGEIQVTFTENGVVCKSCIGRILVRRSIEPTGEAPDPVEDWLVAANTALNAIPQTIDDALEAAKESGEFDGEPGAPGDPGADGFSPVITVTDITGGHRVTITDATGSRTVDIMDGDPGTPGDPGSPGADGVSPTVAVSPITDGHRVTITDASSDHTFDVMDGAKGDPGDPTELIDDTAGAGDTDKAWSADKTAAEVSNLSSALNSLIKNSEEENADLDISDPNGNVLVRFKDGGVSTKNFNSKRTTDILTQITDQNADLYVSDKNGNSIVSLRNGNVQTKKFNSDNGIYENRFAYDNSAGTVTISHFFPKGSRLAFHLTNYANRLSDSIANYSVTYKYTDRNGIAHELGADYGYNFPEYVLETDAVALSATYTSGMLWGDTGTLSFKIYSMASFKREPHILTVDAAGGKEYTSLREAIEYARQTADAMNRFIIYVYPGTYDILSYYTDEEIAVEGFEGLFLSNGISLIGVGQGSEIILTATMDPDDYSSTKRNYVSTLNIVGNVTVKNMTIRGENIRYAVHDDKALMAHQLNEHIFEEVTFYIVNGTSGGGGSISYGAGGGNMKRMYFKNCDFSGWMGIHTATSLSHEYTVYLENCRANLMSFTDYDSGVPAHFYLKNCSASIVSIAKNGTHNQYIQLEGEGTKAMVLCPSGYVYALEGVQKFYGANIAAGKAVKLKSAMTGVESTTSLNDVYGISIGVANGATYVLSDGWVNSNSIGLSGLSVGDYLTINPSTGDVESGGTESNAIAQVKYINSNSVAIAKMML